MDEWGRNGTIVGKPGFPVEYKGDESMYCELTQGPKAQLELDSSSRREAQCNASAHIQKV